MRASYGIGSTFILQEQSEWTGLGERVNETYSAVKDWN
jgi:hypothetical protein